MQTSEKTPGPLIAANIRNLMSRKGVQERQQSKTLSHILGLGYSQAHRKLNGESDWTITEIDTVANYFNESLIAIICGFETIQTTTDQGNEMGDPHEGIFVIESRELPCLVWISILLHNPRNTDFVAIKVNDEWRVVEIQAVQDNVPKYRVEKLELSLKRKHSLSIAIVDDDLNSACNLQDYLNVIGFKAVAYSDAYSLENAIKKQAFDCYVFDWILGTGTAEPIIKLIRATFPETPIILLTGKLVDNGENVSEVARIIRHFDVFFQEKPIKLPIIAAEISKVLGVS